jgi:hypothetical protein
MFNLNQSVVVNEEGVGNYFAVGIHENVSLKDITYETSQSGVSYLKFAFVGANGEEVNHTEFAPDPSREDFQKKMKNFLVRVKHISTKFVPEAAVNINAPTLEALAAQLCAILKPHLATTKLRLKVIYNDKNYTCIPKYVPFVENMTTPATSTKLKLDPGFDKLEKDGGSNPALSGGTPVSDPFGGAPASSDVPF